MLNARSSCAFPLRTVLLHVDGVVPQGGNTLHLAAIIKGHQPTSNPDSVLGCQPRELPTLV